MPFRSEQPESQREEAVPKIRRFRLTGILLLVIAAEAALWILAGRPIHEAVDYFRTGRYEAARIHLERTDWYPLRRSDRDWVAAATALATGREADEELARVQARGRRIFPPLRRDTVLETLIRQSRFDATLAWGDAANVIGGESDREQLLRAAALAATGRLDEAEGLLALVRHTDQHESGLEAVRRAIVDARRGLIPVVVDADGAVLALWRLSDRALVVTEPASRAVVQRVAQQGLIEGPWPTLHLSIEADRQRALASIAESTPGTIAVVDTSTRRLIALVGAGDGDINAPVRIGDLARIVIPAPRSGVYPFTCDGILRVDGQLVPDSGRHGLVPDHESALAWGCSIAASRSAMVAGAEEIARRLEQGGMRSTIDSRLALARVPTDVGSVVSSPTDLAAFAAAIASDGVRVSPDVVRSRTSILGEPVDGEVQLAVPIADTTALQMLGESMRRAVVEARGEAHSLAILGYDAAAMFGNARTADGQYAARIIAYAPSNEPRYAIAIVLSGGGPARGVAGRVAGDVLDALDYTRPTEAENEAAASAGAG